MALLDVKERNFAKYAFGNIIIPFGIFAYLIFQLGSYMEGSPAVVRLAQIGMTMVLFVVCKMCRWTYHQVVVRRRPKDVLSYGSWAVVTGATSGIGECFCHELAAKGMNIFLISRNEMKLQTVAQSVESKHQVETVYLVHDFAETSETAVADFTSNLESQLRKLDAEGGGGGGVGMLCNCVGVVNNLPALFHECDDEEVRQMLCVNNDGTVRLTRAVLPFMFARKKGAIITIGSGSCRHPTPLVSLYSATKSFGYQFTRSLHYEYKEYGIDCIAVTPYYFISNLYKRKKPTLMAPFPESIVRSTLPLLGHQAETFGWWPHDWGCWLGTNFSILNDPADRMLVSLKQNRQRALQKQKKSS